MVATHWDLNKMANIYRHFEMHPEWKLMFWLTHCVWYKIADISPMTFWINLFQCILIQISLSLFLRVKLKISHHWFRQWLDAEQVTRHFLNQWSHGLLAQASLSLNELNFMKFISFRQMTISQQWWGNRPLPKPMTTQLTETYIYISPGFNELTLMHCSCFRFIETHLTYLSHLYPLSFIFIFSLILFTDLRVTKIPLAWCKNGICSVFAMEMLQSCTKALIYQHREDFIWNIPLS